ncbi:MAG: zinc-finger domain-containing protein [Burkholderiales bacterium]
MSTTPLKAKDAPIELLAKQLNEWGGVYCPNKLADMNLWNSHPRVYLDVAATGEAKCPYCGTEYKLKAGEHVGAGH